MNRRLNKVARQQGHVQMMMAFNAWIKTLPPTDPILSMNWDMVVSIFKAGWQAA